MDDTPRPLLYSNFGHTLIKLKAGQIIGLLDRVEGEVTPAENVYLGLAEVFQGIPPIVEEPEGKIPDGFPFLVTLYDDEPPPDFSKADIGTYWTPEQREKIVQVLQDNAYLFRRELKRFNNGIEILILFKPGVDIKDLR